MMTISSGKWAFDSHLLVYSQDPDSRFYKDTLEIFSQVEKANIMAVVTVQNILEAERVFNKVYKKTIKSASRILTE